MFVTTNRYHGSMSERERLKDNFEQRLPRRKKQNNASCDIDVVLTTFSYFSGNKADDRVFLRRFDYDYMVVDEAHVLKNPDSNAYQNIDKLETAHRLLLTGTPVQNSPKELMSLICFLMPLFKNGSKSSWDDEDGKKNDGGASMLEHFVSLEAEGDNKSDDTAYKKLKHLFAPFVLRRRKEDVLSQSMPPKVRFQDLRQVLFTSTRTESHTIYRRAKYFVCPWIRQCARCTIRFWRLISSPKTRKLYLEMRQTGFIFSQPYGRLRITPFCCEKGMSPKVPSSTSPHI